MTRIAVISANLGAYDPPADWAEQRVAGAEIGIYRFDDSNFPPRPKAMRPALQVGMLKWFGPEFVPPADVYLWVDASCALLSPTSVAWFLERLGSAELLVFRHPDRRTVLEEYEFIKARLERPGETYLTGRYAGEWLEQQYAALRSDPQWRDDQLYATTAFMYRPTNRVRVSFKEVWYAKTRWHLHDQLYFAYVVGKNFWDRGARRVLEEKYTACEGMTYVRNRKP